MKEQTIWCERCGEKLNPKTAVWLELSNTDGRYYLISSKTGADAGINRSMRGGIYGERTVSFQRYDRETPIPDSVFAGAPLQVR